jgi:hypothetical protein
MNRIAKSDPMITLYLVNRVNPVQALPAIMHSHLNIGIILDNLRRLKWTGAFF